MKRNVFLSFLNVHLLLIALLMYLMHFLLLDLRFCLSDTGIKLHIHNKSLENIIKKLRGEKVE